MITLGITTFNRVEMTLKSFRKVIDHPSITEILIIDDHSPGGVFNRLSEKIKEKRKVRLVRNPENLGCYHNKKQVVSQAVNNWVILLDSDNVIDNSYVDKFLSCDLVENQIYAPDFAKPHFDYRKFSNMVLNASNVKNFIKDKFFDCLINTCNYVVNKDFYLSAWEYHKEPWTADTLFHNYHHLKAGGSIKVVKGMQYEHLVHDGSHYQQNMRKTNGLREIYMNKLKEL